MNDNWTINTFYENRKTMIKKNTKQIRKKQAKIEK